MNDQQRVGLRDNDDVVEARDRQQPVFGAQIAVVHVDGQHIAEARVAVFVERRAVMQLVPGTQIVPVEADAATTPMRGAFSITA
jgi:hypothetical protein